MVSLRNVSQSPGRGDGNPAVAVTSMSLTALGKSAQLDGVGDKGGGPRRGACQSRGQRDTRENSSTCENDLSSPQAAHIWDGRGNKSSHKKRGWVAVTSQPEEPVQVPAVGHRGRPVLTASVRLSRDREPMGCAWRYIQRDLFRGIDPPNCGRLASPEPAG